jgi:hypothetical protein
MNLAARVSLALLFVACAPPVVATPHGLVLYAADGTPRPLDRELASRPLTVVTFFSNHCPCQRVHDARMRDLIAKESAKGVGFLVVDSERDRTLADDAAESRARGYPIVLDDEGRLAKALDAEYATYSVVLGRDGEVLYRGGFDSNKSRLSEGRERYLEEAVDALVEGRPPKHAVTEALGCTLEVP